MVTKPTLILELKLNPAYPMKDVPRHRFEKTLEESPWRGAATATIELDDPAWELLGWPKALQVHVSAL